MALRPPSWGHVASSGDEDHTCRESQLADPPIKPSQPCFWQRFSAVHERVEPLLRALKCVWAQLLSNRGWKQGALLPATGRSQSPQPRNFPSRSKHEHETGHGDGGVGGSDHGHRSDLVAGGRALQSGRERRDLRSPQQAVGPGAARPADGQPAGADLAPHEQCRAHLPKGGLHNPGRPIGSPRRRVAADQPRGGPRPHATGYSPGPAQLRPLDSLSPHGHLAGDVPCGPDASERLRRSLISDSRNGLRPAITPLPDA